MRDPNSFLSSSKSRPWCFQDIKRVFPPVCSYRCHQPCECLENFPWTASVVMKPVLCLKRVHLYSVYNINDYILSYIMIKNPSTKTMSFLSSLVPFISFPGKFFFSASSPLSLLVCLIWNYMYTDVHEAALQCLVFKVPCKWKCFVNGSHLRKPLMILKIVSVQRFLAEHFGTITPFVKWDKILSDGHKLNGKQMGGVLQSEGLKFARGEDPGMENVSVVKIKKPRRVGLPQERSHAFTSAKVGNLNEFLEWRSHRRNLSCFPPTSSLPVHYVTGSVGGRPQSPSRGDRIPLVGQGCASALLSITLASLSVIPSQVVAEISSFPNSCSRKTRDTERIISLSYISEAWNK